MGRTDVCARIQKYINADLDDVAKTHTHTHTHTHYTHTHTPYTGSFSLKEWHGLLESNGLVPYYLSKLEAIHIFSRSH